MNRVAFRIFGLDIMWYAVIIMIGVIVGLTIADINTRTKKTGVTFDDFSDAFLYAFPVALIGARLYYVIFEWDNYKNNLIQILNIRGGGLAIHGGLIGAFIGLLIYKAVKKKDGAFMLNLGDIAAPSVLIAQAIGRWGNFMNQEAHGGPVSKEFISRFPLFIQKGMFIDGQYYHPTFLYESLWNLTMGIILLIILHKRKENHKGTVVAWYAVLYSIGRFFIEGMRTDSLMVTGLRTAQVVSIAGIVLGAMYLIYSYFIKKEKPSETDGQTSVSDQGSVSSQDEAESQK